MNKKSPILENQYSQMETDIEFGENHGNDSTNYDVKIVTEGVEALNEFPEIKDLIIHGANFWKITSKLEWSNLVEQVNELCIQVIQKETFISNLKTTIEAYEKRVKKQDEEIDRLKSELNKIVYQADPKSPAHLKATKKNKVMETAIELVTEERLSHFKKGRTVSKDVELYSNITGSTSQLVQAAQYLSNIYNHNPDFYIPRGWNAEVWHSMVNRKYKDRLVEAASLILAEIERVIALESIDLLINKEKESK